MVKKNNNIDKTLENLSLKKEAPKSAFILILLIYSIVTFLTMKASTTQGSIVFAGQVVRYSTFAGVFSMLGNICIICLVMLFRRVGYITSLIILVVQFPVMIINIFVRGNINALSGFFSSILIIGAISIIHFSYRKILRYQQNIREQAVTDRITGLPNRFACGELLADFHKHNEPFALVSIDLNDFKSINDTMGHDTGDLVLKEVARRWKELANSLNTETVDFIARNSGDEFMLVISDFKTKDEIENTINFRLAVFIDKVKFCKRFLIFAKHRANFNTLVVFIPVRVIAEKGIVVIINVPNHDSVLALFAAIRRTPDFGIKTHRRTIFN